MRDVVLGSLISSSLSAKNIDVFIHPWLRAFGAQDGVHKARMSVEVAWDK